jgi:hypothetical protein
MTGGLYDLFPLHGKSVRRSCELFTQAHIARRLERIQDPWQPRCRKPKCPS